MIVLLLYIQLFISCFDWLCFTSVILGFFIPVCLWRSWILSMFSTSVRFRRYWRLFWLDFRATLTHPLAFHCLSQTSLPSSLTTSTALRPLNYHLPPLTSLDDWFSDAVLLSCQPTFAGVQSPSGFVLTSLKLSWRWFGCWRVVKTRSARLWILLSLGFSTTDFLTLVCCRVDPSLLASILLLALCLHL